MSVEHLLIESDRKQHHRERADRPDRLIRLHPPVALASPPDAAAWDELVNEADGASIFHTSEWARLWTTQWPGAEWWGLVLLAGSSYVAGLALIVRPRPFGRAVLSMPFGTYGGPLVRRDHQNPSAARRRLLEAYTEFACTGRVMISDLTWYQGDHAELPVGECGETTSTHVRPLAADFETVFRTWPHSVRSRVRQAENQGLIVSQVTDPEGIRAFHSLTMRALGRVGVRAKPLSLYQDILERLVPAGLARYDLVCHDGVAIGGSLHFLYRGVATNWLTVSDEGHLRLRPNHVLIARLFQELCEAGFREYHFGASPPDASGLVEFKESWGARPRPVLGLRHRSVLHRLLRG